MTSESIKKRLNEIQVRVEHLSGQSFVRGSMITPVVEDLSTLGQDIDREGICSSFVGKVIPIPVEDEEGALKAEKLYTEEMEICGTCDGRGCPVCNPEPEPPVEEEQVSKFPKTSVPKVKTK